MLVSDKPTNSPRSAPPLVTTVVPVVHVVDDEKTIQTLFTNMGRILPYEFHTHGTAAEFFADHDDSRPCCLVLDLNLPDRTGIEVLRDLAAKNSRLPVVFMSGMARVSEAVNALKLGSIDFVEKPFDVHDIGTVLRRAVELDLARRRKGADQEDLRHRFESLTNRESQVMELIVRGAANKEVAATLGLSHKTVEVHRANLMRKTGAGSLAELVRMHVAVHTATADAL
ncbi:MAG: response regulator transcription factor [Planctomycetes bacterium]|nr:response regulator transcription factor [Planctomycetota bacterium]